MYDKDEKELEISNTYNNAVQEYNLKIKRFPNNILAGIFGFETVSYFETDESSQDVPDVNFD